MLAVKGKTNFTRFRPELILTASALFQLSCASMLAMLLIVDIRALPGTFNHGSPAAVTGYH